MKSISVIDATKYKDENGKAASLKKLFLKYETNKTRNAIQEAADKREEELKKKEEEERRKKENKKDKDTDTDETVPDPVKESDVEKFFNMMI